MGIQSSSVTLPPVQPGDSASADTLARAVALALANPAVRQRLLEDLRDSPFAKHGIDLVSYLRAARGHGVAALMAQRTGVTADRLLAMASVRGGLQLSMPISSDRANWSGGDTVITAGTPFTVKEELARQHRPFGYTVRGDTAGAPLLTTIPAALFVVGPAEQPFGTDPEATRSAAPKHTRSTVTTFADERRAMYVQPRQGVTALDASCNPETAIIPCGDDNGTPGPVSVGLPSSGSMNSCAPNPGYPIPDVSQDEDQDGVQDQCEYELAQAFHPQMQFTSDDCDTSREPYWAVNRLNSPIDGTPVMQIFYAISYHTDCGSPRPDCPAECAPHYGDSEFIVEEVTTGGYPTYDTGRWYLKFATLSAHYGTRVNSTGTYAGGDLDYGNAEPESNPMVWVSEGKHGNYRTQSVCDAGAESFDNCDRPGQRLGLEVLPSANLGAHNHHLKDNVGSRVG